MIETSKKKKIYRNIFIFCSYFIYQIAVILIIEKLGINVDSLNVVQKNIFLISTDLIYLITIIFVYIKELKEDIKNIKGNFLNTVIKYIPYYVFGVILMSLSSIIIYNIIGNSISENETTVREYIKLYPIYMTFSTVIYAPIVEELIYRKCFRNLLENDLVFVIISGTIFGMMHITSGSLNDFLTIIPYILMGIDLSYIYYKSKNIFTTITLHSIHNFILLLIQFIGG